MESKNRFLPPYPYLCLLTKIYVHVSLNAQKFHFDYQKY
jgi:hypothetical protein